MPHFGIISLAPETMAWIPRIIVLGEPAICYVISRPVLEWFVLVDLKKKCLLNFIPCSIAAASRRIWDFAR
jgi:hypothetical protein